MIDREAPTQCGMCEPPKPMKNWNELKRHVVRVHLGLYPRIPKKIGG